MFIDIHAHTLRTPVPATVGHKWLSTAEQLIKYYDKNKITKGVLLPIVSPECSYSVQSNEEIIQIAEETDRFIPFCNIDPRSVNNSVDAPLGDMLKYYQDLGCKGIGEVVPNLPFLHPMVQNLFKHVEEVGFPLTFHIAPHIGGFYGLYDDPGLPQLELCLQRFPKLKFFGHSQAFWAEMAPLETLGDRLAYPGYPVKEEGALPKLMRKYPNLYGDLSAGSGCNALSRDEKYAPKFMDEFQDRLLFGLDICDPEVPAPPLIKLMMKLKKAGKISQKVFDKVARNNAKKVLKI